MTVVGYRSTFCSTLGRPVIPFFLFADLVTAKEDLVDAIRSSGPNSVIHDVSLLTMPPPQRSPLGNFLHVACFLYSPMARTEREKLLIERFVASYNGEQRSRYEISEWPDTDSTAAAVDALATDPTYGTLAIEHTIVQPFEGEKTDSAIFLRSIAQLDQQTHMLVHGYDIDLTVKVGAVPKGKGINWPSATKAIEDWYRANAASFPLGRSKHHVPGVPFDLEVDIEKARSDGDPHFFVNRWMPPDSLNFVVLTALAQKVPKLVAAAADKRILLLEKDSIIGSPEDIGIAFEHHRPQFQQLATVDEAWVINTAAWPSRRLHADYLGLAAPDGARATTDKKVGQSSPTRLIVHRSFAPHAPHRFVIADVS